MSVCHFCLKNKIKWLINLTYLWTNHGSCRVVHFCVEYYQMWVRVRCFKVCSATFKSTNCFKLFLLEDADFVAFVLYPSSHEPPSPSLFLPKALVSSLLVHFFLPPYQPASGCGTAIAHAVIWPRLKDGIRWFMAPEIHVTCPDILTVSQLADIRPD